MNFSFYSAGQIIFGRGSFSKIGEISAALGKHALVVLGTGSLRRIGVLNSLESYLRKGGVAWTNYEGINKEPDIPLVEDGVQRAKEAGCDMIIAIGGGSVLDTGKAIAGLVPNPGNLGEYLGIEKPAKTLPKPALPWIAVPTTAGTGSEVTNNAVISLTETGVKKSFRSPYLLARVALVDAELGLRVSPQQTALSGMDALSQLIESYVTRFHQPMTDALALEGIRHSGEYLLRAFRNGNDGEARDHTFLASLLSGLSLSNSRLGAVHGLAAAFGGRYSIPHGLICAVSLPYVMETNLYAAVERYGAIGEALTGKRWNSMREAAEAGLNYVKMLIHELNIPKTFQKYQILEDDIPLLVNGSRGNSMSGNPLELSDEQITGLIERMI